MLISCKIYQKYSRFGEENKVYKTFIKIPNFKQTMDAQTNLFLYL